MTDNIPNSPAELIALNGNNVEGDPEGNSDGNEFLQIIEDMMDECCPSPEQVNEAAMFLIGKLEHYHFEVVNSDNSELSLWQRKLFADDMHRFTAALTQLRAVNPD